MKDHHLREVQLNQLQQENFNISRFCRKMAENITDPSLKYYFQSMASRRSQYAVECTDAIKYYGGTEPHLPLSTYGSRNSVGPWNPIKMMKKSIRIHKNNLLHYQGALALINDGACREMLIRHKAYVENCVFELKALKKLFRYREDHDLASGVQKAEEQV